jgi:membrane associated rhomboid family serine protease
MFYFFYYFPLGLDLRPQRRARATWTIFGACVATFLLQRTWPLFFWANWESLVFVPAAPSPSSLVLNAYLHGSWLHLASNLLTLAVFGPALEERLGARRFVLLFTACNILANCVQATLVMLVQPHMATAGVLGASGAIAGLLGLFLVRAHFARLRVGWWVFMPLQAYTRCGIALVPSACAIVAWFVIQAGMALLQNEGVAAGVACGSHLGGVVAGALLGLAYGLHRAARAESRLHAGRRYRDRSHWFAAQGEFLEYVRRQPNDEIGHLELARTYRLTGRHPQADHSYRRACALAARAKRLDRVEEIVAEATRGNWRFVLEPAAQLQHAHALERALKLDAARRAYERLAEEHPRAAETPTALLRAARLAASRRAGARGQSGAPQAAALASTDALLVADTTASAAGPADDCPFSAAA